MMHKRTTRDGYYECHGCGLVVEDGPFDDGYYPLNCEPSDDAQAHRHYIVASFNGGECYYCGQPFNSTVGKHGNYRT